MLTIIKKRFVSGCTCTLVVCGSLLLAAAGQAQTVIQDPAGNVVRIENLLVKFDNGKSKLYNVDFRFATGFAVYGENLNDFDFSGFNVEGEGLAAMFALNTALNGATPIPGTAGEAVKPIYYIGLEEQKGGSAEADTLYWRHWQRVFGSELDYMWTATLHSNRSGFVVGFNRGYLR